MQKISSLTIWIVRSHQCSDVFQHSGLDILTILCPRSFMSATQFYIQPAVLTASIRLSISSSVSTFLLHVATGSAYAQMMTMDIRDVDNHFFRFLRL